jgi:hypothetical protein
MWPVTSVRCDSFSFRRRFASASGSLGWVAGVGVTFATGVGVAGIEAVRIGGSGMGAVGTGTLSVAAGVGGGVETGSGIETGVGAETGVGIETRVGAEDVPVAFAAAPSTTARGMRTDFRQRLQSIILTLGMAAESTTMGAEQWGQSKRISLLIVPDSDAPVQHR